MSEQSLSTVRQPALRAVVVLHSDAEITALLRGLTLAAQIQIEHYRLPLLYQSGIRYRQEPPGQENWLLPVQMLARGVGDCEDLASYRAAELRIRGVQAWPIVVVTGKSLRHAVVGLPGGRIEDPSRRLGM